MIAALSICLCTAATGCTTRVQQHDRYLREASFGESISEISRALGGIEFEGYEAGSSLYPFWTLRGRVGTTGIALGAVGPPGMSDPRSNIDALKYIGHFILQDGSYHSIRWVYTDGLVKDSIDQSWIERGKFD